MSEYRRWRQPGGSYFFTVVTHGRRKLLASSPGRQLLGEVMRACRQRWPFHVPAIVVLPEHLHTIWSLPPGDQDFSRRWAWIKREFSRRWLSQGGREDERSPARAQRGDRGVWQPRFWEHLLRDESDFDRHFDYIHFNPVKHGHVTCPADWPASTFARWVAAGVYQPNWGGASERPLRFDDLDDTAMELGLS